MVIAKHLEEIVQHEERGQIERLDVLELDQQLQKALPNSQAPIEEKRPELADVGEQNFVDQPILQQFDKSLRFIRTYQSVRGDTIRGLPRARRASDAWSRAPESSTSPTPAAIRNNCLNFTLFVTEINIQIKCRIPATATLRTSGVSSSQSTRMALNWSSMEYVSRASLVPRGKQSMNRIAA